MGIADRIRIAVGRLTPEETAERDAAARARREQAERRTVDQVARRQAAEQQRTRYQQRISRAAGVASVQLVCHRDTWLFIKRWTNQNQWGDWAGYYNTVTDRDHGLAAIHLSGPQLIDVLTSMAWVGAIHGTKPLGASTPRITDQAIARRVYDAIGAIVDQIDPDAPKDHHIPPIVIDDRAAPPEERDD
jgi:hypothetical protein